MRILYLLILSLTFLPLSGDDHDVVKPGGEVGEFHYFDVLNPAAFVGAMDKFHASNCSKTWHSESGAAVALWELQVLVGRILFMLVMKILTKWRKGVLYFSVQNSLN